MTLREIAHVHIPSLTESSTVRDAVDKMDIYQFPALVVVDGDSKPIAVVTEGDLCRAVSMSDSLRAIGNEPALAFGTRSPLVADCGMEISEAFHRMLSSGLTLLPVVEADRLTGIVVRADLMRALLADDPLPYI